MDNFTRLFIVDTLGIIIGSLLLLAGAGVLFMMGWGTDFLLSVGHYLVSARYLSSMLLLISASQFRSILQVI